MTRGRLVAAALTVALIVALIFWQRHREALGDACISTGGAWDGARSACISRPRPILQRDDLKRS
jgi:hypothetical protein